MNAMLTQAKAAPGMVLRAELLDADPYALCTPSGIVDLHTGLLRAPQWLSRCELAPENRLDLVPDR
ncbi:predicted protein [Streptomyces sp. C]|nr:predicted protein [Streptomyces sp. C]